MKIGDTPIIYTNSIKKDLSLDEKIFKKMKVYHCMNCFIIQNTPWFSEKYPLKYLIKFMVNIIEIG